MTERPSGIFVTFEGPDGSGKTTQLELLARRLAEQGREVVCTVEPGGTLIGNQIRTVLLDRNNTAMSSKAELLLYFAARAQNVDEVIKPAIERGAVVLSDRYTDSTLAYQGAGRGLGAELVRKIHDVATGGLWPDLTYVVDVPANVGLARRHATTQVNRLDAEHIGFHEAVRREYLALAATEPKRIEVVDGTGTQEHVAAAVWDIFAGRFLRR